MGRVYNFSPGPAMMPLDVLQEAQKDLVDWNGTGMSVMETPHRGAAFTAVRDEAVALFKELAGLGDGWSVAFLGGGASMQFAMLPLNFLGTGGSADYADSGTWGWKALKQAQTAGDARAAASTRKVSPARMPLPSEFEWNAGAAYAHVTTNETISGAQMKEIPEAPAPLVADMSSDIFSVPRDYSKFSLFYAGAQKNLGPAGMAVVAFRREFALSAPAANLPEILRYSTYCDDHSLYNTPLCWNIYMTLLTLRRLRSEGLAAVHARNAARAAKVYAAIDSSPFWRGTADKAHRSVSNITFRLPSEELEALFVKQARDAGMAGLEGHRSAGGLRASMYNAFPEAGADRLVEFMKDFERRNG